MDQAQYLLAMGESEVDWAMRIGALHAIFQSNPGVMGPGMWSEVIDHIISTWPQTLWVRLPWGPEPHLGLLGGLSGWGLDLALDRLDFLVAEVVGLAHRTPGTVWPGGQWLGWGPSTTGAPSVGTVGVPSTSWPSTA